MEGNKSIKSFFKYLVIGFLISSVASNFNGLNEVDIIRRNFITFMYNLTVGIGTGIAGLFSVELFHHFKKNFANEKCI